MKTLSLAIVLLATAAAHATPPITAIEIDREDAPAGRVELGFDGGAPLEGWAVSLGAGLLDKPLTVGIGDKTAVPVARRESLVLGGALAFGSSVVADVRLPMSRQTGDQLVAGGDGFMTQSGTRYVLGDLRIAARVRIAGGADRAVFLRGAVTLPTGDDNDFAGEARWGLSWNLIGRATLPAGIVLAGTAGIHIRGAEVMVGNRLAGDEILGAVGIIVPIPPIAGLWCQREQVQLTAELDGVLGDNVNEVRGPSPVEVRGGLVIQALPSLTVGFRGGHGLDNQIGAPTWRAMFEIAWRGDWQIFDSTATPSDETLDE